MPFQRRKPEAIGTKALLGFLFLIVPVGMLACPEAIRRLVGLKAEK
jgi:hypothetical protein